ncbi:MAG: protein TonB [Candidatus Promineifilaceae bacterium]|jgi:protein TonB
MQTKPPTLNIGLLLGIAVSLLLHGSLLGMKTMHRSAAPQFESGVVSIELSLVPSIASVAVAESAPLSSEHAEALPDPIPEETPAPPEPEAPTETESPQTPAPVEAAPARPAPQPVQTSTANTIDQDGDPKVDKGALTEATSKTVCRPVYPRISRRRGEEGVVVTSIDVDESGRGSNPHLVRSSGHTRLDAAALKALKTTHFTPASRQGHPCKSTLTQTFTFRLTDE